ncbi:MAG: hypothetical protein Q6373_007890, partial [Candidatus Sigynarchaeota archaeon]
MPSFLFLVLSQCSLVSEYYERKKLYLAKLKDLLRRKNQEIIDAEKNQKEIDFLAAQYYQREYIDMKNEKVI